MNTPLFLVIFFSIFHLMGGLAVGKGIRERMKDPKAGMQLIFWGLLMGGVPILFDWFFLIREGNVTAGLSGPVIFFFAIPVGGFFFNGEFSRKNEKSIGAGLMGETALMLGLMMIPYLLGQAQTRDDLELVDYLCGGSIPLIFIFIGASFGWTGLRAILKGRGFDEHIAEREIEIEERTQRSKKK